MTVGKRLLAAVLLLMAIGLSAATGAQAAEYDIVRSPNGKPIFRFNYTDDPSEWEESADWDIRDDRYADLRAALVNGAELWAEILGAGAVNSMPASITVFGDDDQNAGASSPIMDYPGFVGLTAVSAMLLRNLDPEGDDVAFIEIGSWYPYYGSTGVDDPAYYYLGPITHLPQNGDQMHLASTLYHEIGHTLGISSSSYMNIFDQTLSIWDQHLRDNNGNAPAPGQSISADGIPGYFFLAAGTMATFVGDNVMEVIGDAMPNGIPVNGWEGMDAELSHIELRNSMMSHTQPYQNYCTFMEVELAALQDLGYDIDRKAYYGRSIYGDNGVINNTAGFNSAATAGVGLHVYGTGNTITQLADIAARGYGAIGIRIDGWENDLTVAPGVTIGANGAQGRGVAVAYGRNHVLNIAGAVTATGGDGIGLGFDFGSNAMGDYFGYRGSWIYQSVENTNRQYTNPAWKNLLRTDAAFAEINGALADKVDISGSIIAPTAIYISENAYVREINILNGAVLAGDIVSEWRLDKIPIEKGHVFGKADGTFGDAGEYGIITDLVTTLSFGKAMDASGASQSGADNAFRLRYDGDIHGQYSMGMHVVGGELEFNGTASVFKVTNDGILSGNGVYDLAFAPVYGGLPLALAYDDSSQDNPVYDDPSLVYIGLKGGFTNNGTLAPGGDDIGTMAVKLGSDMVRRIVEYHNNGPLAYIGIRYHDSAPFFMNAPGATLAISFAPDGRYDTLEIQVTEINDDDNPVINPVTINGAKAFQPVAGFYRDGLTLTLYDSEIIKTTDIAAVDGASTAALDFSSPTLRFSLVSSGPSNNSAHTITASRDADAYRRFAADPAGSAVAAELDRLAAMPSLNPDAQRIFGAIDWSADADAVAAGLHSLAPVQQSEYARSLIDGQHSITRTMFGRFSARGALPGVRLSGVASEDGLANLPAGHHRADDEGAFFFLTPNGGGGRQSARGWDTPGYSFWHAGMTMGVEKRRQGGMIGLHFSVDHIRLDGKTTADRLKSTGVYLGVHGRLSPAEWGGWHVFGSARAGVELADQRREVIVGSVRNVNTADWTGFAASAQLGGGHDSEFGAVTLGPFASLDYAMNHNPSFTEDKGLGRLEYRGATYNSLRSNLGVRAAWELGCLASASVSVAWTHELLDRMGTTRAGFVGYGDSGISIRARTAGRDSLTASGGVRFSLNERTSLSVEGGGEFFRNGYISGWGGMTLTRAF